MLLRLFSCLSADQQQKKFSFDKLLKSGESETLTSHSLTVEYTGNPAWFAIQALPYLADFPRESADQAFNKFYAFSVAGTVANASPAIRKIVEKWKTTDTSALLSQLEKKSGTEERVTIRNSLGASVKIRSRTTQTDCTVV